MRASDSTRDRYRDLYRVDDDGGYGYFSFARSLSSYPMGMICVDRLPGFQTIVRMNRRPDACSISYRTVSDHRDDRRCRCSDPAS